MLANVEEIFTLLLATYNDTVYNAIGALKSGPKS